MSKRMKKSYGRNMEKMEIKLPKIPNLDELLKWLGGLLGGTTTTKFPNEKMFDSRLANSYYRAERAMSPLERSMQSPVKDVEFDPDSRLANLKPRKTFASQGINPYTQAELRGYYKQLNRDRKVMERNIQRLNDYYGWKPYGSKPSSAPSSATTPPKQIMSMPKLDAEISAILKPKNVRSESILVNGVPTPNPFFSQIGDEADLFLQSKPQTRIGNKTNLIRDKVENDILTGGQGYGLPDGMTKESVARMREWMNKENNGMKKRAGSSKVSKRADGPNKNKYF